jgi:hypothetical protein
VDKTHHAGQAPATRLLLVRLPLLLLGGVLLVLLFTRPADAAERRRSGLLDHAGRPAGRSGGHLPCSPDRTPAPPATRPAAPTTDAPTGRAAPRAAHGRDQAPAPLAAPLDLVRGSLGGLAGPLLPGGLGGMVGPVLPGGLLRVELPLPRVPLRPLVAYSTPRAGPVGDLLPAPTSASTGPALLVPPPGAGARRRWRAPPCRPAAPRDPHLWRCQARPALPGLRRAAGTLLGARRRPASGWPSWPTRCSCSACGAKGMRTPNGRVPAPAPASPSSLRPDGFDVLERPGPHPKNEGTSERMDQTRDRRGRAGRGAAGPRCRHRRREGVVGRRRGAHRLRAHGRVSGSVEKEERA